MQKGDKNFKPLPNMQAKMGYALQESNVLSSFTLSINHSVLQCEGYADDVKLMNALTNYREEIYHASLPRVR